MLQWLILAVFDTLMSLHPMPDGLRAHTFFFNPSTLLELGMDVHLTVQTPRNSLVLTAGALHQILNLTAVEGWSCNFLPPCMLDVVNEVRMERSRGWSVKHACTRTA